MDLVDFWLTWSRDFSRALTHVPLSGVPTPSLFAGVSAVRESESAEKSFPRSSLGELESVVLGFSAAVIVDARRLKNRLSNHGTPCSEQR